jgi:AcrR family transcriptional regulator
VTVERVGAPPARGTRPANRRQLIVDAAAELFSHRGYGNVGMGDVADAVAIGPSALYRHFRGKRELLATVVTEALETLDAAIGAAGPSGLVEALAAGVLAHRGVGVLWQREARQLDAADQARIQEAIDRIVRRFSAFLTGRRPELTPAQVELLAWSGLAVATSVSYHGLTLPEPAFTELLAELATVAIDAPIPPLGVRAATLAAPAPIQAQARRETILSEATKLFAAKGFSAVSTEEIGASVGMSGPSVYHHFPTKSDILLAAMLRGDEWLRIDMHRAFARASDSRDALTRLLESYCSFGLEHPHLVQVLVCESGHLADAERHRTRSAQHAYIAEWVTLLRDVHPQWDDVRARIRVQAAQTMVNDIALLPSMRGRTGVEPALLVIGARLFGIDAP